MIPLLFTALAMASPATATPDGSKLRPGESCYVTMVDGRPNATILRRIARASVAADAPWVVTIVSKFTTARIDSRMTLAYADLRPIELKQGDNVTRYTGDRVFSAADDLVVADRELPQPIWEQLGIELVVTALPLAEDAHFDLPVYGGGEPGVAQFDVTGSAMIDTPDGKVDAWRVVKRSASDLPITFLIAKADRRLVGIDVDTVSSRLGGDCSALRK